MTLPQMECLMRLTEELIASLQRNGQSRHLYDSVVEGLCLSISGSGAKTWYLCSEFLGEDERIKLGVHPKLSVKAARLKANRIDALADDFEQKKLTRTPMQPRQAAQRIQKKAAHHSRSVEPARAFQHQEQSRLCQSEQQREQAELQLLWNTYEVSRDLQVLSELLRSRHLQKHPLPAGMAEELADFLDLVKPHAQAAPDRDDDHIFMVYWRHTELKTGSNPLVLDEAALAACADFMEAIGRPCSRETLRVRVSENYADWRVQHEAQLQKSTQVLKDLPSGAAEQ
ncbi:Arm DNA-binding domain-containing protein [Rhodobacterales bacterium FZCC0083]|nr:Arm DNA-binding domain-containing protein [Rhodobacterales bacterium FZCC0083]